MSRLLIPLFLMCMAGVIGLYVIVPQYEEIRTYQIEETALLKDLEDVKTISMRIDDLKAQYAKFPPGAEEKLHVFLPRSIDTVRFIIDMNAMVSARGFKMMNPSPAVSSAEKGGSSGNLAQSTFGFQVEATYEEFKSLLEGIERSLALRDVSSVSFSAPEVTGASVKRNSSGVPLRTYNLQLTTYSYAQ